MGKVNCCIKPDDAILETQIDITDEVIKDKGEYPQDSEVVDKQKQNNESDEESKQEIKPFSDENQEEKEKNNEQNEKPNEVNYPSADNNEFLNNNNYINSTNEEIPMDINNYGAQEGDINGNINLNELGMQNLNDFNQMNENGDINQYLGQNDLNLQGEGQIDLNQYNLNNDNNQINALGMETTPANYVVEGEYNLNDNNIYSSAFTFGDNQQINVDSLANSIVNSEGQQSYNNYNYQYMTPDSLKQAY